MPDENVVPETPQQESEAIQKEQQPAPDPTEVRLAEILGAQKELTDKVQQQDSLNEQVLGAISGLAQKLDALGSVKPQTQPQSTQIPVSTPQDPSQVPQTTNIQEVVQNAVKQALEPITGANSRLEKHRESFQKVVATYPELADATSRDAQIFNQIYRTRKDLQAIDDAPSIIAGLVRDMRAQEKSREREVEQRKTQAVTPIGIGRGGREINPTTDSAALVEQYNQLRDRGRRYELTRREQGDFLNLATALKHLGLL